MPLGRGSAAAEWHVQTLLVFGRQLRARGNPTGRDPVHRDAMRCLIDRECAGETDHSCLGRSVGEVDTLTIRPGDSRAQ